LNPAAESSLGAQWVDRYLLPVMHEYLPRSRLGAIRCLQIEPDDEQEARQLRRHGHGCEVVLLNDRRLRERDWELAPRTGGGAGIPSGSGRYDLILTGRLGQLAGFAADRKALAEALAALCNPGGALLTVIGNRRCLVDLTGNASLLHGRRCASLTTLEEMEEFFVGKERFSNLRLLQVAGHFSWSRARGPLCLPAWLLERFWRHLAVPERRWLYAGPLNPVLALWLQR